MSRLWDKDSKLDPAVLAYTVGDDYILDLALVPYDCAASIAHAEGLKRIGVFQAAEVKRLAAALRKIVLDWEADRFFIEPAEEDLHTAIENRLTKRLGKLGKKIHTGRSRNDQVLVCLRLFGKQRLIDISLATLELARVLAGLAKKDSLTPMPGYTHTRQAMPTTVGHLFSSWAESLLEDLEVVEAAYRLNDRCPLGAAAGFGVSLKLDREYVARRLGFSMVQKNTLNAVSSRAKIQWLTLIACSSLTQTLGRLATDLITFSDEAHGFFILDDRIATGSSIMPQKRNPDVFELLRANAQRSATLAEAVRSNTAGLGSGYHRDVQLTKEPFMLGAQIAADSLLVAAVAVKAIHTDKPACLRAMTSGLFAADRANELVSQGVPFREAYRRIKGDLETTAIDPSANLKMKIHTGAPGNLGLASLVSDIGQLNNTWKARRRSFRKSIIALLGDY